jgi:hypothetical protein
MQAVTTIGFDIAKSAFQVHAVDAQDNVAVRRQLKRRAQRVYSSTDRSLENSEKPWR